MTDMSPAEAVYFAAAALPAADRAAYLARACAGDDELRRRVERMLAARPDLGAFLEPPPAGPADGPTAAFAPNAPPADTSQSTADFARKDEHVGGVLAGRYKLIEEIGEGGMGTVFMAQQTEPVKRAVAVKVIKAGMDSKAVLARFEAERQALAMMDHPNIARVLDAGTTGSGRPFFIMDLVKGTPITRYCDEHKLTPRQRLELFVPICQAIQHAHQKGIIHRDIKPSNVLVALYDDKPVPKVIDFGVAKAAGQLLTDKTLMTGFGAVVGTPEYMSPEQASLNNLDIDTRSDVYSLGVLLYELLTGTTPVDKRSLGQAALFEILRVVREVEAPRPSAKLSTIDTLPSVAANRGTEPARLSRLMKGELDWLVMKALEKDRTRRYETANGLVRDVQRYLDDEVVEARPPSVGYRVSKFVRRHKGQVIAAGLVLLALLAGITGTTLGLLRAEAARQDEARQRAAAEAERNRAQQAEVQATGALNQAERTHEAAIAVLAFFQDRVLSAAEPGGLGPGATIRAALDAAEPAVAACFPNQPTVEASVRNVLGQTYLNLGEWERAVRQYARAEDLSRATWGPDDDFTAHVMAGQGVAHLSAGRPDRAVPLFERALPIMWSKLPTDDAVTLQTMGNLAAAYQASGQLGKAVPLLEQLLQNHKAKLGAEHPQTVGTRAVLVLVLLRQKKWADAEPVLRDLWAIRQKQIPDSWLTFNTQSLLGGALIGQKKYAEAEPLLVEGYQGMKAREKTIPRTGGAELRIPVALDRLVALYTALNKPDEAKKWQAERAKYLSPKEVAPPPREKK
jgi:serine/threonine protein kinase